MKKEDAKEKLSKCCNADIDQESAHPHLLYCSECGEVIGLPGGDHDDYCEKHQQKKRWVRDGAGWTCWDCVDEIDHKRHLEKATVEELQKELDKREKSN